MRWSWKLGHVAGIRIQVHWTFLLIVLWVILVHASRGAGVGEVAAGVLLVLTVFGCVVLHELGHALTARRYGIATRDITLLPIGGVARLERMPDQPAQELIVAAAGPAVNVVIAGLLWSGLAAVGAPLALNETLQVGGNLVGQLLWINVMLVLFNLLPAFPMDGGRMLRAVLAYRMPYVRATRIAAAVGQAMAILLGFGGLLGSNPFLIFIAIFVYLGAQAEAQQAQVRVALAGVTVQDAMMTRFVTLSRTDTLARAVEELLAGAQQDFPVVEEGRVMGILARADLVRAIKERGDGTPVSEVMRKECVAVREGDPLGHALPRLRASACSTAAVLRGDRLVGLLTLENVGEFLMVHAALGGERAASVAG